jgi:BirA family biotin operon repressor/biotin-[acetyl-CoA-carboxylase] ligase
LIAWRLELFDELGSTSDHCVAAAKSGAPEGLAVQALRQTAGRGSRGRAWQAPEGNLNLSVLLRPSRSASESGLFSLLTGVAVAEALEALGAPPTMLKWPNDILLNGEKLAGILIDAAPRDQKIDWLVIGIGINLAQAPSIPGRATTSLAVHGLQISPQAAAAAMLESLSRWHDASGENIQKSWLAQGHKIGTSIEIQGATPRIGTFAGLSPSGELLLAANDRIERISTGDILLGRP